MSQTKITSATVKVMRSFDYCHFEIAMQISNDTEVTAQEIDDARKQAMRLADKAVEQYKIAKEVANKNLHSKYDMEAFERKCKRLKEQAPETLSDREKAELKAYEDDNWENRYWNDYDYDYEDDFSWDDESVD